MTVEDPFDSKFDSATQSKYIRDEGTAVLALAEVIPHDQGKKCIFVGFGYNDKGALIHNQETSAFFNPAAEKQRWVFINWVRAAYRDADGNQIHKPFDFDNANAILDAMGGRLFKAAIRKGKNPKFMEIDAYSYAQITPGDYLDVKRHIAALGDPLAPEEPNDGQQASGQSSDAVSGDAPPPSDGDYTNFDDDIPF